jgi:hypothetical protein
MRGRGPRTLAAKDKTMSLSRLALVSPLLLGLCGCASSIRVGGSQTEGGAWEYKVVHATELAKGDASQIYGVALGEGADPELAAIVCKAIEKGLNELAGEGWVLVDVDQGAYVLRRSAEE